MQILIDLVRALKGLGRLLRFDPGYRDYFGTTVQSAWRSFFAMMLVAPTVALDMPDDLSKAYPNATAFKFYAVTVLLYVINWIASPVVAFEIGRRLNRVEAMPGYITIYNWFQLAFLPVTLLQWAFYEGSMPALGLLVFLLSLAVYLFYLYHIAKSFLSLASHQAALFVIADLGLFLLLVELHDWALLY